MSITNTNSSFDAAVLFTAGGDNYTMGIDNSDSDRFKLYYGTGLGTGEADTVFEYLRSATDYQSVLGIFSEVELETYRATTEPLLKIRNNLTI